MKVWLPLALMILTAPAWAADCQSIYGTPWVSLADFSQQPFGTLGFVWNDDSRVFVPDPGTPCISIPRNGPRLHFLFNHRSDKQEKGYVSFKLYGFDGPWNVWTRLLERTGAWLRGDKDLQDPWKKLAPQRPTPSLISDYEAFYKEAMDEAVFDSRFGAMHGKPKGSDYDSWDDLTAMQPQTNLELPKPRYLAHSLQRVEAGPAVGSNRPDYFTNRFEYQTLVMHAFSPMADGPSSTIVFKITN